MVKTISNLTPDSGLVILEVSREWVEKKYYDEIYEFLTTLNLDQKTALRFRNKCQLFISGYDEDPRELFEIEEVREYVINLDKMFPYWFFFLAIDRKHRSLHLILFCCCRTIKHIDGNIEVNVEDFQKILATHYQRMNEVYSKHNISQELNDKVSLEIREYFYGQTP